MKNDDDEKKKKKKKKKEKKKKKKTPTTTTTRCRYSSFDHPKTNDFLSSAHVVPTFLSSIEVFAFPNAKETTTTTTEEERRGKKRRLSIEALDSASFSVIRKCTIADVLNAHFVHEYVKEEKE